MKIEIDWWNVKNGIGEIPPEHSKLLYEYAIEKIYVMFKNGVTSGNLILNIEENETTLYSGRWKCI